MKKVRQKFEDSGSLVVNVMKSMDEEINNISCLLLGKIKKIMVKILHCLADEIINSFKNL